MHLFLNKARHKPSLQEPTGAAAATAFKRAGERHKSTKLALAFVALIVRPQVSDSASYPSLYCAMDSSALAAREIIDDTVIDNPGSSRHSSYPIKRDLGKRPGHDWSSIIGTGCAAGLNSWQCGQACTYAFTSFCSVSQ